MFQENLKNKNLGDLNRIYKKCLKEENILKYNDFNQKSLFFKEDNLKNFFEEIFNSLHSSNLTRKINIEYLGFTDGIETDFMLKHLSIKPFDGNKIEDTFFTQKITNIQDLNNFILSNCENIIDDLTFFQPISRINLDDFNINFNSILNLNDSNFNNIKIEFLTNFKEMSFGFYKKEFLFEEYDVRFPYAEAVESEVFLQKMAVGRLMFPYRLSEKGKKQYETYLREHLTKTGQNMIKNRDAAQLGWLLEHYLETKIQAEDLLEVSGRQGVPECTACLMEWKKRKFGEIISKGVPDFDF